jgi:hypothetical protein
MRSHFLPPNKKTVRWYADNSELNGIWSAKIPDILMFGGIAIEDASARELVRKIRTVKRQFTEFGAFPIKWNFMDMQRWFEKHNASATFAELKRRSREWRRSIIDASIDIEFTIVLACVKHHSARRHIIRRTRAAVAQFAFADALQRVGLLAKDLRPATVTVVLDWPDSAKAEIYTDEYRSALWKGTCHHSGNVSYHCGALHELGFEEQLLFTQMADCPLLQFSDLVMGATREFVDYALGKKRRDSLGVEITEKLIPKFRGYPRRIVGRGISVASSDASFRNALLEAMLRLRENN